MLRHQRIADHVADVVGDEIGLGNLEMIHDTGDVDGLVLLCVAGIGMRRETHSAQVWHDDRMILDQHRGNRRPHIAAVAESMQHHDRRTVTAKTDMNRRAVGLYILRVEARRKGFDFCRSRRS